MDKIKTSSNLRFRTEGLVETPLPLAYDAAAMPGANVLGSDGATYVSKRSSTLGAYRWDKTVTQSSDGSVVINASEFTGGALGLIVCGFGGASEFLPGRIGLVPGIEPATGGVGVAGLIARLEFMSRTQLTAPSNLGRPTRITVDAALPGWTTINRPCNLTFQVASETSTEASGIPRRLEIFATGHTHINVANGDRALTVTPTGTVQIGNTTGTERLSVTGNIQATNTANSFMVGTLPVVGSRKTGWAAPTGTATRSTFDTSTATTAQLAERLKALIDDLTTHGLIGT